MAWCGPITKISKVVWAEEGRMKGIAEERLQQAFPIPLQVLDLKKPCYGQLKNSERRLYITPPLTSKRKVTLTKLSGKARAAMTVCKVDRNLYSTNVWHVDLASKFPKQRRFRKTLCLKQHLLSVHIEAASSAHVFEYELRLE